MKFLKRKYSEINKRPAYFAIFALLLFLAPIAHAQTTTPSVYDQEPVSAAAVFAVVTGFGEAAPYQPGQETSLFMTETQKASRVISVLLLLAIATLARMLSKERQKYNFGYFDALKSLFTSTPGRRRVEATVTAEIKDSKRIELSQGVLLFFICLTIIKIAVIVLASSLL